MIGLINDVSTAAILNILYIVLGCSISFFLFRFINGRFERAEHSIGLDILIIFTGSLVGAIIPLGTYGIVPISAAAYSSKFKSYLILPFIVSNYIFNMTVPFSEPNFTWKTGIWRIILAFIAGICAGIIGKIFSKKIEDKLFHDRLSAISPREDGVKGLLSSLKGFIEASVIFVLVGVVLNSVFQRFILYDMLKVVYSSAFGTIAFKYMNNFDVMNPFFMLALTLINVLMNITQLSALVFMLRIKGVAVYLMYFIALVTVLASSIYFL